MGKNDNRKSLKMRRRKGQVKKKARLKLQQAQKRDARGTATPADGTLIEAHIKKVKAASAPPKQSSWGSLY